MLHPLASPRGLTQQEIEYLKKTILRAAFAATHFHILFAERTECQEHERLIG